jgi:FHA domain/Domain of unknown function (DUF1707)
MASDTQTPLPVRPSEEEREQVIRLLRDRSVEGRISTDAFADRVWLAWEASSRAELAELTSDVRPASRPRRLLLTAVDWFSRVESDVAAAWNRPRVPTLDLPPDQGSCRLIGRASGADCRLPDACVSRRHAEVWRSGNRWLLRDLGSRNGTRVNGMYVFEPVEVRPGDLLDFGGAQYRLSRPRTRHPHLR